MRVLPSTIVLVVVTDGWQRLVVPGQERLMRVLPLQMQVTLFTRDVFREWAQLMAHLVGIKDLGTLSDPTLMPLVDAPPEFPRMICNFKEKGLVFEGTGKALTFKWVGLPSGGYAEDHAKTCREVSHKCLLDCMEKLKVVVTRTASVATWVMADLDCGPGEWVARRFFREELRKAPFNRPQQTEVHSHKVYTFGAFTVNSWGRVRTEKLANPDREKLTDMAVTFMSDINTLAENAAPIQAETATAFFEQVWAEHVHVRSLYIGA
ncbi:MAG: hypothetical protein NTW87_00990 [Planctomycetota bacterium]|nr:hypothetical protein [Planctomycetota bacterium]